jgi:hypothetical protein
MIELANAPSTRPFTPSGPARPAPAHHRLAVKGDPAAQAPTLEPTVAHLRVFKPVLAKPLTAFGYRS